MILPGNRNLLHWVESGISDLQLPDGHIAKGRHHIFVSNDEN